MIKLTHDTGIKQVFTIVILGSGCFKTHDTKVDKRNVIVTTHVGVRVNISSVRVFIFSVRVGFKSVRVPLYSMFGITIRFVAKT